MDFLENIHGVCGGDVPTNYANPDEEIAKGNAAEREKVAEEQVANEEVQISVDTIWPHFHTEFHLGMVQVGCDHFKVQCPG